MHFPGIVITHHPFVKGRLADKVFKLFQKYGPHAIGGGGIGAIRIKMIRMLAGRFLTPAADEIEITLITRLMWVLSTKCRGQEFVPRKISETFIHPGVERFVGSECHLVPTVGHFMRHGGYQPAQLTFSQNEGTHGILHSAIASLDDRIGIKRIPSEMLVEILKGLYYGALQFYPIGCSLVFLIKKMQFGTSRDLDAVVRITRIGRPGKIDHVFGDEVPEQFAFRLLYRRPRVFIAMSDLIGILKLAGTTDYKFAVDGNPNIKVSPNTMKFAGNILVGMPSLKIIFCHFWVPLGHRIGNAFPVVSSGSSYLQRYLCFKFHVKNGLCSRKQGFGQDNFQNGLVHLVPNFLSVLL